MINLKKLIESLKEAIETIKYLLAQSKRDKRERTAGKVLIFEGLSYGQRCEIKQQEKRTRMEIVRTKQAFKIGKHGRRERKTKSTNNEEGD